MIRLIDEHRDQFGVELICRTLRPAVRGFITSRGYRAAKTRPPSARRFSDDLLVPEVVRLHAENYGVYGRRKMHASLRRQGWDCPRYRVVSQSGGYGPCSPHAGSIADHRGWWKILVVATLARNIPASLIRESGSPGVRESGPACQSSRRRFRTSG